MDDRTQKVDLVPATFQKGARVAVAMSGGVDSSVVAALLKDQGYEVMGLTMKTHDGTTCNRNGCCTLSDVEDARNIAHQLGIPHYVINVKERFQSLVIDPFVAEYVAGRTPNPCVWCNTQIKFGELLQKAMDLGAEGVATGHYGRVMKQTREGCYQLYRGVDSEKDQSYVLFELQQHQLSRVMLPLGEFRKADVRGLAERWGLDVAGKKDSSEICFVPENDYGAFVSAKARCDVAREGPIVLSDGTVVGTHKGLFFYTVGQKKRLNINGYPNMCVTALDPERNAVVVGPESEVMAVKMRVDNVNWIGTGPQEFCGIIKVRYRHGGVLGRVFPISDDAAEVRFDSPVKAVTPGQAAVWYEGDRVFGGGWIHSWAGDSTGSVS